MKSIHTRHNTCTTLYRQTGLSLVELMISVAIGLLLLLGISTLIAQQSRSHGEMEKSSRQIENGRYAMQLLHDDIQLAGFYGEYYPPALGVTYTSPDPCLTAGNLGWSNVTGALNIPIPIAGYAGAATDPTPSTCLDNYLPNTSVVVIRRTSTFGATPVATATATTTYLQVSKCEQDTPPFVLGTSGFTLREKDCTSTATPAVCDDGQGLSCLRPYIVRIYYISSCSVCGVDTIPTLKMVEFTGGSRTIVPLVEGIENMQLDFGIDDTGNDGEADLFTNAPDDTQMPSITSVKVYLLSRNNDTSASHTDSKIYSLGETGVVGPFNDKYKRHVYSQLVRAINPSGRRE